MLNMVVAKCKIYFYYKMGLLIKYTQQSYQVTPY